MSARRAWAGALAAAVLALVSTAPAGASADVGALTLSVDRTRVATTLGHTFVFRSTIANTSASSVDGLILHLNVTSLRSGVYVDPEDWSTERTQYIGTIPAGGTRTSTWRMTAVTAGTFGVYLAALTQDGQGRRPRTGPAIHVVVAGRETLNPGGVVPLAVGVPACIGAAIVAIRLRARRAGRGGDQAAAV